MKILACYNMKGGVGKTTSAVNLAYYAAQSGARVLLWDLDPQGGAAFHLGVEAADHTKLKKLFKDKASLADWAKPTPYANLDVVPAGFGYRNLDVELGDSKKSCKKFGRAFEGMEGYDYIFLDCPPSISSLSQGVFCAADRILMPLTPSALAQKTFAQVREYLSEEIGEHAPISAFFTMVDKRKTAHKTMVLRAQREAEFCENYVPLRADVEAMGFRREPLPAFAPESDAALAYRALWKELVTGGSAERGASSSPAEQEKLKSKAKDREKGKKKSKKKEKSGPAKLILKP